MGKRIYGRVVNDKNEAVEFAVVFLSDSKGKPIGNVNTQTDTKGRFVFNSLKDTDFLTSQMVGLKPTTISVKKAINIPSPMGDMPTLAIKMPPSDGANLDEIVVTATKPDPKKDEPKKDEPKKDEPKKDEPKKDEPKKDEPKKGMSKGLKIGLIVGGSIVGLIIIGVIIHQVTKRK
jgi:outer membrane biosynthesis protein TonB